MKKSIFYVISACILFAGISLSCSDHNDFSSKHVYTPAELEQIRIQDSIKEAQKTQIKADVIYKYNVSAAQNNTYTPVSVTLEGDKIAQSLGYDTPAALIEAMGDVEGGLQVNNDVAYFNIVGPDYYKVAYTANGHGYWIDGEGKPCGWGASARLYFEFSYEDFQSGKMVMNIGQMPENCKAGDKFTVAFGFQNKQGVVVATLYIITITGNE